MKRFIEGEDRGQVTLLPECLDDFVGQDNPVRVVDAFVEELHLQALGDHQRALAAGGMGKVKPQCLARQTPVIESISDHLRLLALPRRLVYDENPERVAPARRSGRTVLA